MKNATDNGLALTLVDEKAELAVASTPDRDIRIGLIVAAIFFILFLGGAAFVRLDAAAYAPALVSVAGQRQAVQHREGGTVGAVLVREGDQVKQGALLVSLADPQAVAEERAYTTRYVNLLAERARLSAELMAHRSITPPPEFTSLPTDYRGEAASALRLQQAQMDARYAKRQSQGDILTGRGGQSLDAAQGFLEQVRAADQQIKSIDDELEGLRPLAEKGFVSQSRLRSMERARADLVGKREQYTASLRQAGGVGRENVLQRRQIESDFRAGLVDEYDNVNAQIDEIWPKLRSARDRVTRGQVVAPVSGKVVGISVFNAGAVIAPGQHIMEIVPDQKRAIIEARVSPDNADDITVGQRAEIRFPGVHVRSLPTLEGRVSMFSADRLVEEKSGVSYFLMHVEINPAELRSWEQQKAEGFTLHPGMPAEVIVPIRKRTALQYIFDPLVGVFWKALHED